MLQGNYLPLKVKTNADFVSL